MCLISNMTKYVDYEYEIPKHCGKLNEFISSFWIGRKWIFETVIDIEGII